jgi:hypothetical protein
VSKRGINIEVQNEPFTRMVVNTDITTDEAKRLSLAIPQLKDKVKHQFYNIYLN